MRAIEVHLVGSDHVVKHKGSEVYRHTDRDKAHTFARQMADDLRWFADNDDNE